MVVYCCVQGCNNKRKKKDSNLSFHAFPPNPFLRKKWLWSIGQLDWKPPSHARVCSAHFSAEQIKQEGNRIRIKDDACPIKALPVDPSSIFVPEEICRICLATDVKMYSLKNGEMRLYMYSIPELTENLITDNMPQCVCYECAVQLKKCCLMMKKSMRSKKILLDMVTQNGQIDKSLLNINREYLKLKSMLTVHEKTPTSLYHFKYDDEQNISILTNTEFVGKMVENNDDIQYIPDNWPNITPETVENNTLNEEVILTMQTDNEVKKPESDSELITDDPEQEEEIYVVEESDCELITDDPEQEEEIYVVEIKDTNFDSICVPSESIENVKPELIEIFKAIKSNSKTTKKGNKESSKKLTTLKGRRRKSARVNGLTPVEIALQKNFDVIQLTTLQEQIDGWYEMVGSSQLEGRANVTKCEVCSKYFLRDSYRRHVAYHDPRRGNFECPVCKQRFKRDGKLSSHLNSVHTRKFKCRSCNKVLHSLEAAKNHQKFHSGHRHKCDYCSYSSMHGSTLFTHIADKHSHALACEICGRTCISAKSLYQHRAFSHAGYTAPEGGEVFSCEECKLKFNSENALRVHLLTSLQHRDESRKNPALKHACKQCGAPFHSAHELVSHKNDEHRHQLRQYERMNCVKYPAKCEYCDASLLSRRQHYHHVLRQHPAHLKEYQPLVTAVCETCGKGCSSTTQLRIHELRHSNPRERCEPCGKMFYDKHTLAKHHANVHCDERPYICDLCDRAFKVKGNLMRHILIHTGELPYKCSICSRKFRQRSNYKLHVRTVHLNMPHPPKKKRKPRPRNVTAIDSDTTV